MRLCYLENFNYRLSLCILYIFIEINFLLEELASQSASPLRSPAPAATIRTPKTPLTMATAKTHNWNPSNPPLVPWMGRCRAPLSILSRLLNRTSYPPAHFRRRPKPVSDSVLSSIPTNNFFICRLYSALPAQSPIYNGDEFENESCTFDQNYHQPFDSDEESDKISVRAFFLSTRFHSFSLSLS